MASIDIAEIRKAYGPVPVLQGIDLSIRDGEFVVLVGPSGCGKSTLLRMIAGLEDISAGEIRIDGRRVNDLEPKDRDIAMVFQSYALYPHMTVADNIAYGLRIRGMSKDEVAKRVKRAADMLELGPLLDRRRFLHASVDLRSGQAADAQAISHVVVHAHVRIERVVLEHHRDVAVLGLEFVHHAAADRDLAGADRLEPGDHAQQGGLAAA